MHILTVFAHPSPRCFCRELLTAAGEEAAAKGHAFTVRDLCAENFSPVLSDADLESFGRGVTPPDIRDMQEAVTAADIVMFIHPVWWFGLPAVLKGWIDRVFTYGFAYGHDTRGVKPLLFGKKAAVICTAGAEETAYTRTGVGSAMEKLTDEGIYRFVGLDILLRRVFYEVPAASDERRREMIASLRSDLRRVL